MIGNCCCGCITCPYCGGAGVVPYRPWWYRPYYYPIYPRPIVPMIPHPGFIPGQPSRGAREDVRLARA